MPRVSKGLSPASAKALVQAGEPGKHAAGVVAGLSLVVRSPGRASWVLRTRIDGRSTDRALGDFAFHAGRGLTLAQARDAAGRLRVQLAGGADPLAAKRAARAAADRARTFAEVAALAHAAKSASFRNAKHAEQWIATLQTYVYPTLGTVPVADVRAGDVADALRPVWQAKPETARRVAQRIAAVLRYAEAHGWTERAPVKAALELLGGQQRAVEHQPALPVDQMRRFMPALRAAEGMGARALEFAILTAARSGEVRDATWGEVDLQARLWTIPGARMKAGRQHAVPLSAPAVRLLEALPRGDADDLIFPGERGALSDMTLSAVARRLHAADVAAGGPGYVDRETGRVATPHGFRSTFRDWCAQAGVSRELAERALAHAVGDKTEAAYYRDRLIEERRPVMERWAAHCA